MRQIRPRRKRHKCGCTQCMTEIRLRTLRDRKQTKVALRKDPLDE